MTSLDWAYSDGPDTPEPHVYSDSCAHQCTVVYNDDYTQQFDGLYVFGTGIINDDD